VSKLLTNKQIESALRGYKGQITENGAYSEYAGPVIQPKDLNIPDLETTRRKYKNALDLYRRAMHQQRNVDKERAQEGYTDQALSRYAADIRQELTDYRAMMVALLGALTTSAICYAAWLDVYND
jgi:hypothetical protein